MKTILMTVDIGADPADVYSNLTQETGLGGWWSTDVSADLEVGGRVRFTFLDDFNPVMEILELEQNKLVKWRCVGGHDPWADNIFDFTIEPGDGRAVLLFRHEYAKELGSEDYGRYAFNWGYYLQSLKRLCETGEGTPYNASGDSHDA